MIFKRAFWCFIVFVSQIVGVEYYQLDSNIHVLKVDPKVDTIRPIKASGRATVLFLTEENGADAGVNGGFFSLERRQVQVEKNERFESEL